MKVGIITMHKVINFGSALQAYALQKKVEDSGCEADIIDYKYPNAVHKDNHGFIMKSINYLLHCIKCAVMGFPNIRQALRYRKFWRDYFHLSPRHYNTEQDLKVNCPEYDIYMTGSDQVWNSRFTKSDSSFLLEFVVNGKKKCSYSSSFAFDDIPDEYIYLFERNLPKYDKISVREESGVRLVKGIINKDVPVVCDPTLLLTDDEWSDFSKGARIYTREPYVLAYILAYSFNPFPDVDYIVEEIQRKTGLKVIYLDAGRRDYFKPNSIVVKDAGPKEFVSLFKNAKFVITSSFHGTVFSINFKKPFYSIIKEGNPDSRIMSILRITGLESRGICANEKEVSSNNFDYAKAEDRLEKFRCYSIKYLEECLR